MAANKDEGGPATHRRPLLRRHLALVLVIKLLLLIGLWQAFVKPYRVRIDAEQAATRIAEPHNQINQGE